MGQAPLWRKATMRRSWRHAELDGLHNGPYESLEKCAGMNIGNIAVAGLPASAPVGEREQTEREGFEPPVRLPAHRISSAIPSAARTPLPME